jgi:hypothetical protein
MANPGAALLGSYDYRQVVLSILVAIWLPALPSIERPA